jgi:hypothetical protein
MTEFIQVFDGDLAQQVFLIVSLIFVALYACGILFLQRTETGPRRTVFHAKTAMNALFLAVAISVIANGLGVFHSSSSGAAKGPVSISISELQRAVDMKSLPVQRVESLF